MEAFILAEPPARYLRRSVRLHGHAYDHGLYLTTICTAERIRLFGEVRDARMWLSPMGLVARDEWVRTFERPEVVPDVFVVMPDHVHVLFGIIPSPDGPSPDGSPRRGTARCAPTGATGSGSPSGAGSTGGRRFGRVVPRTVPAIVRAYKSAVTRTIRRQVGNSAFVVWQRGYHDRVVRTEREAEYVRRYIEENAERWDRPG